MQLNDVLVESRKRDRDWDDINTESCSPKYQLTCGKTICDLQIFKPSEFKKLTFRTAKI